MNKQVRMTITELEAKKKEIDAEILELRIGQRLNNEQKKLEKEISNLKSENASQKLQLDRKKLEANQFMEDHIYIPKKDLLSFLAVVKSGNVKTAAEQLKQPPVETKDICRAVLAGFSRLYANSTLGNGEIYEFAFNEAMTVLFNKFFDAETVKDINTL